jgi:hypothetical protein
VAGRPATHWRCAVGAVRPPVRLADHQRLSGAILPTEGQALADLLGTQPPELGDRGRTNQQRPIASLGFGPLTCMRRLTIRRDRPMRTLPCSRSTALFQLATELPAAVLARMLGIHISVAVAWQRACSGDWAAYAADAKPTPRRPTPVLSPWHRPDDKPEGGDHDSC